MTLRWIREKAVLLSRGGAELSGWLYLLIALLVTSDVLTRRYLGFSTKITDEVGNYVLAVGSAWSMAYALKMKDHVRMEVLLTKLPRAVQGYLNVLSLLLMNAVLLVIVSRMWAEVSESVRNDARSFTSVFRTPLAWPQAAWAAGFSLFLVVTLIMLLESLALLTKGRAKELAETLGPRSAEAAVSESSHSV